MDIKTGLHCEAVERHGFIHTNQQRLGYMSVIIAYEQSAVAWSSSNNDVCFFSHHSKKEKSNPVKYKMQFTLFMTKLLNSSMEKLSKPTWTCVKK